MGLEPDRLDDAGAVVVAPAEAADENKDVMVFQAHGPVDRAS